MCKRPDQKTSRTWNEKGRLIDICHIYEVPQFILYISFHVDPSFNCMPSFYLVLYMRIYIFFVKKFVQNALPESRDIKWPNWVARGQVLGFDLDPRSQFSHIKAIRHVTSTVWRPCLRKKGLPKHIR